MKIADRYHLTYCTNIHPAETWEEVKDSLEKYLPPIKKSISPRDSFGIGLRLSNQASLDLNEKRLLDFKTWLDDLNLYVFTLNGFPYGAFHGTNVKDQVHVPDWRTPERKDYTLRSFDILAELLPEGMDGGISTSPLSYKPWFKDRPEKWQELIDASVRNLLEVVIHLINMEAEKGIFLHLDIEPEPDGILENTAEVIDFYEHQLLPTGSNYLKKQLGFSNEISEEKIRRHLQVCYDVCHFAVEYENHQTAFERLTKAGIGIGKIQVSAALKSARDNDEVVSHLRRLDEPVYLHQTLVKTADNDIIGFPDLSPALDYLSTHKFREMRTHFHVPIFTERYKSLNSTQSDVLEVMHLLQQYQLCHHLEIETYTWEVLPKELQLNLKDSIVRELQWFLDNFKKPIPDA